MYGPICFFHMLTVTIKNKLLKLTCLARKIIGIPTLNLLDSVSTLTHRKAHKILGCTDTRHSCLEQSPSMIIPLPHYPAGLHLHLQ